MRPTLFFCLERLRAAQTTLRRRTSFGDTFAFAQAFADCEEALHELGAIRFGDARVDSWLRIIRETLDTSALDVWDARGKLYAKVELLTSVERATFQEALDRVVAFLESAPGQRCLRLLLRERGLRDAS